MSPPLWLRKLIRPLIPDRVMARFRLAEHSRQVRSNVDVVVTNDRDARRWLATTPDTYRVRTLHDYPDPGGDAEDIVIVGANTTEQRDELLRPLTDSTIAASVRGGAAPPRLVQRRRTEPTVGVEAVAVRTEAFSEVGGEGAQPDDLWYRLRDAGHRIALLPTPPAALAARTSPITSPAAVILAAVPAFDVGGGSRGAQLANALIRRGYHVTYAPLFGVAESTDLGLRFVHPQLEQPRATEMDVAAYLARLRNSHAVAIVELPARPLLEPARMLKNAGFTLIYDLIDNWKSGELGGEWYEEGAERTMVGLAHTVTATAPDLVAQVGDMGAVATLVPNGVNADLFGGDPGALPTDFPPGNGPVLGYHGSLYGDWFDWPALRGLANSYPAGRVLVIGDPPRNRPDMPSNVHFLGLKPQRDLPAYIARFDVGVIPWLANEVTHAVHPLKTYEYLACGVPVASPPLRALEAIDGVYTSNDLVAAVDKALRAPAPDRALTVREHSYDARLQSMLEAAGLEVPPVSAEAPRIVIRQPVHYTKDQRRP